MPRTVWIILWSKSLVDLLAQAVDEHVDDVGARVEAVVPDVRQDHRLRHHAAGVAHQVFEQRELARPQRSMLAAAAHRAPRTQVEREVADRQPRRRRRRRGAADQRLDAGEQLRERERLGQVVVAAGLQPATRSSTVCRALRISTGVVSLPPAQLLDQREAVELREHDVDDGDVVVAVAGELAGRPRRQRRDRRRSPPRAGPRPRSRRWSGRLRPAGLSRWKYTGSGAPPTP